MSEGIDYLGECTEHLPAPLSDNVSVVISPLLLSMVATTSAFRTGK